VDGVFDRAWRAVLLQRGTPFSQCAHRAYNTLPQYNTHVSIVSWGVVCWGVQVTNTTQWEKPDLSQDGDATAAASPDSASGQVDAIDEEVDATGLEANTTRTPVGDTPVGDTPVGDTPADAFSGHMEQGGDDDDAEMLPAFRHNDGDAAGPGVVMDDGLEQARNSPQMAAAAALQLEKARQERLQQAMQRRGKLVDSLVAKDAAIDPCVPTWIAELAAIDANPDFSDVDETTQHGAKSRPLPDIEAVASTLREGFHGYREMYEASFRWLADVHERETERKLPAATLATCGAWSGLLAIVCCRVLHVLCGGFTLTAPLRARSGGIVHQDCCEAAG